MRKRFLCLIALMAALWAAASEAADSLSVSFVNIYPGSEIYELEGHSALRIHIPGREDMAVNYGLFDFNSPNFVYRFVKGETDYMVGMCPWSLFESLYEGSHRKIVEHRIPMDSVQGERLLALLTRNLEPQNRVYRYNYVKDNCATRPMALVEQALGCEIELPEPSGDVAGLSTFRDVMRYYHRNYPWYQFGIDLALGSGIDYEISAREKAFAPVVLDSQLGGATVGSRKLVDSTMVIADGPAAGAILGPTPWYLTPMAVACVLLLLAIVLTIRDMRRLIVTRWFDTVVFGIYGLAGLLVTFLVFVSVHEATSPNWLLLWLNPLCLIVPIFIWLKKCKRVVLSYQIANFAALIALAVIWPLSGQSGNAAFMPLVLCDALRSFSYIYVSIKQLRATK